MYFTINSYFSSLVSPRTNRCNSYKRRIVNAGYESEPVTLRFGFLSKNHPIHQGSEFLILSYPTATPSSIRGYSTSNIIETGTPNLSAEESGPRMNPQKEDCRNVMQEERRGIHTLQWDIKEGRGVQNNYVMRGKGEESDSGDIMESNNRNEEGR